jgi:hypothetical protein
MIKHAIDYVKKLYSYNSFATNATHIAECHIMPFSIFPHFGIGGRSVFY